MIQAKKIFWFAFLFACIASVDQYIKYFFIKNPTSGFLFLQNNILRVGTTYYENAGLSWSIPFPMTMTIFLSIIFILVLFTAMLHAMKLQKRSWAPTLLIIVGALSNMVDRIIHGFVVDYISFDFFSWRSSIINIADIMIVVGLVWWIVEEKKKK